MYFRWLNRFIRRHTHPIHENNAVDWKRRLSFVYAFIAWNSFAYVAYMVYTGRADWAKYYGYKTEEDEISEGSKLSNYYTPSVPRVYRIHGLSSIEDKGLQEKKVEK